MMNFFSLGKYAQVSLTNTIESSLVSERLPKTTGKCLQFAYNLYGKG